MSLINKAFADIFTFSRASSGTRINESGLMESVPANQPRLDYDPLTLQPKGILIEEQRTNLLLWSQDLANGAWVKNGASVVANATTDPAGGNSAFKLVEDTSNGVHQIIQAYTPVSVTNISFSIYLKAAGRTKVEIGGNWLFNGAVVDLSNGSVSGAHASKVSVNSSAGGWWRVAVSDTVPDTSARAYVVRLFNGSVDSYAGDGSSGVYIWGPQLEIGVFATSYIPTTTAQVTRAADFPIRTLGAEFNAAEWTVFIEWTNTAGVVGSALNGVFSMGQASGDLVQINHNSDGTITGYARRNTSSIRAANAIPVANQVSPHRYALSYKSETGEISASYNGSMIPVYGVLAPRIPISQMHLGRSLVSGVLKSGHIRKLKLLPRYMTDAQRNSLTA